MVIKWVRHWTPAYRSTRLTYLVQDIDHLFLDVFLERLRHLHVVSRHKDRRLPARRILRHRLHIGTVLRSHSGANSSYIRSTTWSHSGRNQKHPGHIRVIFCTCLKHRLIAVGLHSGYMHARMAFWCISGDFRDFVLRHSDEIWFTFGEQFEHIQVAFALHSSCYIRVKSGSHSNDPNNLRATFGRHSDDLRVTISSEFFPSQVPKKSTNPLRA